MLQEILCILDCYIHANTEIVNVNFNFYISGTYIPRHLYSRNFSILQIAWAL